MTGMRSLLLASITAVLAAAVLTAHPAAAAGFSIRYLDPPGEGFNDTTPVLPVPGNPGNTLGQQRRNVMNHAASVWAAVLESDTEIIVDASFSSTLECTQTSAVLGGATTSILLADFAGAPRADTWYPAALADALAGKDLCAEPGSACAGEADILAVFNRKLDDDPECLNNARNWYYGLDHNPGGTGLDFLNVLLHELAHGLGFQTFTDEIDGGYFRGQPTVYDRFIRDLSNQQTWVEMTAEQRVLSATNAGNVVWDGPAVTAAASGLVSGKAGGSVILYTPDPPRRGSSISHWDTSLAPDALMEPRLSAGLESSINLDLTPCILEDLGWEHSLGENCAGDVPPYPEILASSAWLDLGSVPVGDAASFGVRIENPGQAPLQIGPREAVTGPEAPFSVGLDTCSNTVLAQGEGCVMEIVFAPTESGQFEGELVVTSNDPLNPQLPIQLNGAADDSDGGAAGDENATASTGEATPATGDGSPDSVPETGNSGSANPFGDTPPDSVSGGGGSSGPFWLLTMALVSVAGRLSSSRHR